jgi:hypothetical protein
MRFLWRKKFVVKLNWTQTYAYNNEIKISPGLSL